jgi:predicted acetyltransferase
MNIEIARAARTEQSFIGDLLNSYLREILPTGAEPAYEYLPCYWTEPERFPFLIRVEDRIAGFALIRKVDEIAPTMEMAEFYVIPEFRRRGIGRYSALAICGKFPCYWRIEVIKANHPAVEFWTKCLAIFSPVQREADPTRERWEFHFEVPVK